MYIRSRPQMRSRGASQMGPHQVSYVDVAQRMRLEIVCAEAISFPTIGAKYNGPLKALNGYIAGVTYD
eukprot:scaffold6460_cov141-Skeletonema_menzelii.AAC.1